ncbi:hypothetical protein ACC691_38030, partial [Rhizobium johnstonii]|uniref:hypothetical protein n=1 Tax=Rhizobium johnstonii TaxID=3019933 RepID=UPI003F9E65DA
MTLFADEGARAFPALAPRRRRGRVVTGILVLALAAGGALLAANPARVTDQLAFWGFRPSAEISEFTQR